MTSPYSPVLTPQQIDVRPITVPITTDPCWNDIDTGGQYESDDLPTTPFQNNGTDPYQEFWAYFTGSPSGFNQWIARWSAEDAAYAPGRWVGSTWDGLTVHGLEISSRTPSVWGTGAGSFDWTKRIVLNTDDSRLKRRITN